MDDVIVRPRYPRHNTQSRRKRRNARDTDTLAEKIMRQIIICLLILVTAGIIKSVNTPVTNYLTEKIKGALFYNIEINNLYSDVSSLFKKAVGKESGNSLDQNDEEALPASAGASGLDGSEEDVTYDSYSEDELVSEENSNSDETAAAISEKYSFINPVDGVATSLYGSRLSPVKQDMEMHTGIDIEVENGGQVRASLDGEVLDAGSSPEYGKFIKLMHSDGIVTVYAHCSKLLVKKGDSVKQGNSIAEVGNMDISVGSHLHFEVLKDGKHLNPLNFVKVPTE